MKRVRVIPVIDIRCTWKNVTGRRLSKKVKNGRFWFCGFADRETYEVFLGLGDLYAATSWERSFDAFLGELTTTIDHEIAHVMDQDSGWVRRAERLADAFENAGRWARK